MPANREILLSLFKTDNMMPPLHFNWIIYAKISSTFNSIHKVIFRSTKEMFGFYLEIANTTIPNDFVHFLIVWHLTEILAVLVLHAFGEVSHRIEKCMENAPHTIKCVKYGILLVCVALLCNRMENL